MSIMSFSLNKIDLAKADASYNSNVNVASNIQIKEIKEANINLGSNKQGALKMTFEFSSVYGNNVAHIRLGGNVLFMAQGESAKKVVEDFKKNKKINTDLLQAALNHIYTRCNVHAVALSRELQLPPPVPMPRVAVKPKEAPKAAAKKEKPAKKSAKKEAAPKKKAATKKKK